MTIQFQCGCGQAYQVADEFAGKHTRCKLCSELIQIPDAAAPPTSAANGGSFPPVVDTGQGRRGGGRGKPSRQQPLSAAPPANTNPFAGIGDNQSSKAVPPIAPMPSSAAPPAAAQPSVSASADSSYEPQLSKTGKSKSMGNMAMRGELKQMKGVQLVSSDIYHVGEPRSLMQRLKDSTIVGPLKFSETSVDQLQLFRFQDSAGEFSAVVPFDNGMIAPIEFVAKLSGSISHSITLLKQSGGRVGLTAGAVVGGPLGALISRVGSDVESVWAGCDGSVPPLAEAAQQQTVLREGIRWEGKVGGGPVSEIHHLGWGAQLLPLDGQSSLLVAQSVPKQKMLGLEFGVSWFHQYRNAAQQFVSQSASGTPGSFEFIDPGVWLAATVEVLGWVSPDLAAGD